MQKLILCISCFAGILFMVSCSEDRHVRSILKDVETYAKHPAHLAAAAIIKDVKQLRACVDYNM